MRVFRSPLPWLSLPSSPTDPAMRCDVIGTTSPSPPSPPSPSSKTGNSSSSPPFASSREVCWSLVPCGRWVLLERIWVIISWVLPLSIHSLPSCLAGVLGSAGLLGARAKERMLTRERHTGHSHGRQGRVLPLQRHLQPHVLWIDAQLLGNGDLVSLRLSALASLNI